MLFRSSWVTDFGIEVSLKLKDSFDPHQSIDRSNVYKKYLDDSRNIAANILTNAELLPFGIMNTKYEAVRWFDFVNEFH